MNAADTSDCKSSPTADRVQPASSETASIPDRTEASGDARTSREAGKLLFGNGRLDRWLSERRALHRRPKTNTLDGWLSPSKIPTSSPKRNPSVGRSRTSSPENSPARLRPKTGVYSTSSAENSPVRLRPKTGVYLESSDQPQSPSTDIRRYFRSHAVTSKRIKSDCEAESEHDVVSVVDLVADSPPSMLFEQSSEVSDRLTTSPETVVALPEEITSHETSETLVEVTSPETSATLSEATTCHETAATLVDSTCNETSATFPEVTTCDVTPKPLVEGTAHETSATLAEVASHETSATLAEATTCHETAATLPKVTTSHETAKTLIEVTCHETSTTLRKVTTTHETVATVREAISQSASCRCNSNNPRNTSDSEHNLEWWATSRTKSSTRKGPFKRSLGMVHFLNEVCFYWILSVMY